MKPQISAIARLQGLAPLFRGAELTTRFQWDSKTTSHYLYLWKRRKLVQALGGHSDVFANLLISPNPNWEKALLMAMPSAVLVGVEVLRRAGWVTQIPDRPNIAVNPQQPVFKSDIYTIEPRDPAWFATVAKGINPQTSPGINHTGAVPALLPAWALADMLNREGWGACGLWPDDLDMQVSPEDQAQWAAACIAFKLSKSKLVDQLVAAR